MNNKNIVELRFHFDEDINFVKEKLLFIADKEWKKGERSLGNVGPINESNGFSISSGILTQDLNKQISEIIQKIQPHLNDIIKNTDLFQIELSVFIYLYETHNGLHLNRKNLEILNLIGAEIDIDIYNVAE